LMRPRGEPGAARRATPSAREINHEIPIG
jgi:hypothetical protein